MIQFRQTTLWTALFGPTQNLHENFQPVDVTKVVNLGLHLNSVNVTWFPCQQTKKKH